MLNNDTRPKRKTLLDLDRLPTKKEEYHDPVESVEDKMFVEGFFKLLDPTDVEILKMTLAGYTRQQIAEKLGFQTHSAVTKRLHKLKPLYLKYIGEEK